MFAEQESVESHKKPKITTTLTIVFRTMLTQSDDNIKLEPAAVSSA